MPGPKPGLFAPPLAWGQLSITGTPVPHVGPPSTSAGVWALLAPSKTELDAEKAKGPETTAALVAYSLASAEAIYAESKTTGAVTALAAADGTTTIQATHEGPSGSCTAISGTCAAGRGVAGFSKSWQGVYGHSVTQAGVVGESERFDGVFGRSRSGQHAGTTGINNGGGMGVFGTSGINERGDVTDSGGVGVRGAGGGAANGVEGFSDTGHAIHGASGNGLAGFFDGKVEITGDLIVHGDVCLPRGADFAESFAVAGEAIDPGTVVVISDEDTVRASTDPYDPRVAGVVSGAGPLKPGVILSENRRDDGRRPLALAGRTWCKVDAAYGAIAVGDLLTSSATPGHAMKAADPSRAPGAVIGKALRAWHSGTGLIPILVVLQ
jgi:hypothetical protein